MIVRQALVRGLDRTLQGLDLHSQESWDLLLLWAGLFFTPYVLPVLPLGTSVTLVDCAQSSVLDAAALPSRGSRLPFCSVVLCYAEGSSTYPLSMVVRGPLNALVIMFAAPGMALPPALHHHPCSPHL
jgi:hypothetical protein